MYGMAKTVYFILCDLLYVSVSFYHYCNQGCMKIGFSYTLAAITNNFVITPKCLFFGQNYLVLDVAGI